LILSVERLKRQVNKINWFQHDTDSTQDAKIKKLIIRHGALGYAVYFHCLELIASDISESNLTFELEHDSEIIADNLHVQGTAEKSGREVVERVMTDIINLGLFTQSEGRIFCFKLLKRINLSMTSNPSFRSAISKKKEENHDDVMTRHDTVMRHYITLPTLPTIQEEKKDACASVPHIKRFTKPTIEEITAYCAERNNLLDPQNFLDFYESKGWKVGQTAMKDWRAAVRTWERRDGPRGTTKPDIGAVIRRDQTERAKKAAAPEKCPDCGNPLRRSTSAAGCTCGVIYELISGEWKKTNGPNKTLTE
jgi:hypothetical protein